MKVTFVTGNANKADFMAQWLGHPIAHAKLDLDEIQSLDANEITRHKALQAYDQLKTTVLVEDASLTFTALGKLPGPYIKWFLQEITLEGLCRILDAYEDRSAVNRVVFCLYDGESCEYFSGHHNGLIPKKPRGLNGFGYDPIFIPNGSERTYAEMTDQELGLCSLRTSIIFPKIKKYLTQSETLDA